MTTTVDRQASEAAAEALTGRLFGEGVGAFHLLCVHIGSKLGLYRAWFGTARGHRRGVECL